MEWVLTLASSFAVLVLVIPLAVLVGTILFLWGAGHLLLRGPVVSRTSFDCPFSKRKAAVEFLTEPGSGRPSDVLSCSVFSKPYHVRCKKECLALVEGGWGPSPMMPRFALLSGGVAYRPVASRATPDPEVPPSGNLDRAA